MRSLFLVRFQGVGCFRWPCQFGSEWYPWDLKSPFWLQLSRCFPKTWHPKNPRRFEEKMFFSKLRSKNKALKEREWRKHICKLHGLGYFATYNIGIHVYMFGNNFCISLRNWYFFGLVGFETLWEIATKDMEHHITTTFEPGKNLSKMKGLKAKKWVLSTTYNLWTWRKSGYPVSMVPVPINSQLHEDPPCPCEGWCDLMPPRYTLNILMTPSANSLRRCTKK